jgi:DNA polymerase III subunit gamma/tau
MDNFIVSARKYRPVTFDTVVGQQSITNTLKNAIRNNQLAQAFLFCGPRGVGKTTCARILAKTINCEHPSQNIEPCNECTSCKTFNESSSFNIHELDAASNNSVDDIRSLVEQVRIPPQMGKYKVYIIDEVHMLSAQAFNAFLKTLEEPPSYTKFILATTEKHKIIPTILSRCQIFDFKRITVQDIAAHLVYVASKEEVEADHEALHIIAQKADGALRDALSMFDQMVNLGNHNISRELVIENLNVLDYDYYFKITEHMLSGNYKDVLLILNDILEKGFDGQHFIIGMGEHLRSLLMCKDSSTVKLIETSKSVRERYLKQSKNASVLFLINALDINNKCDVTYRTSSNKRLNIEIALIQMCQAGNPVQQDKTQSQDHHAEVTDVASSHATEPASQPSKEMLSSPAIAEVKKESRKEHVVPSTESPLNSLPTDLSQQMVSGLKEQSPSVSKEIDNDVQSEPLPKYPVSSMHSIKDVLNQGAQLTPKQENLQPITLRQEPYGNEQVLQAFSKFADSIREESALLYTALTAHQPVSMEDFKIRIILDNAILQKELNDSWNKLMDFLKDELSNDLIQVDIEISTQSNDVKKFMTDKEKLEAMNQKNPNVASLTDQLNLELDIS